MRNLLILAAVFSLSSGYVSSQEVGYSDGLDELNALRAARGLPAYVRDAGLTQAAGSCAVTRARTLCFGHLPNDFAHLPPGSRADASGCAAYPASYGWLSCAMWDRNTYAGAAWAMGMDGKRYMHLFISKTPSGGTVPASAPTGEQLAGFYQPYQSQQSYQPASTPSPVYRSRLLHRRR